MKLPDTEAWARLAAHDHGVLSTLHPDRGVDAVPVVYAVEGDVVGIPIDTVKPKASMRLQRERNLEFDPRATLLVEHWDAGDWSQLWWVRAELRWEADAGPAGREGLLVERLVERYRQYRSGPGDARPLQKILVLRLVAVTGWSAAG